MGSIHGPVILALTCFGSMAQEAPPDPAQEDIVYSEAGGERLTMDFYKPSGKPPYPVAIIVHGGGFTAGTSRNRSEAYCADFLAPAGYAVFSINYRLAPRHPYPAALDDVVAAVRYIRKNAHRWEANPYKIAVIGGSAGGYLSNMMGIRLADPESRVQAVVTLFGPSDLRGLSSRENVRVFLADLIRQRGETDALAEASPIQRITSTTTPFLLIHGDKDETVPVSHSLLFQKALQARGISCELLIIPGGAHATGKWHTLHGVPDWEKRMVEWLNKVLRYDGVAGAGIRNRERAQVVSGNR